MRKFSWRHSCALVALAGAAAATPAFAQVDEPGDSDEQPTAETIIVTGSLIRGTPEDAALPVNTVSAEELSQKGITSPLELIKELPSVGSVLGDTNQFSTASQGFQGNGSINLRGLGFTRTLVLLNGKRTIQAPGDGFTDTNLIPLFALQRVEILKDGAAATYGSDAIAGVANFITRDNFDGVEVAGDWTFVKGSDDNFNVSGLIGKNFGGLNLLVGAGWQHRSELPTTARDYTSLTYDVNASGYSALATPGLFAVTYLGAGGLNTITAPDKGCTELGGYLTAPVCRFTYIPFDNITEEEDRYQAYAQANADLSDSTRWHASALWAKTDLESINYSPSFPPTQGPKGSGFRNAFTTSPANPAVAAFLAQQGLPASGGANGNVVAVTNVFYRPLGFLGNPLDPDRGAGRGSAKNNAWRINTGLEFDVGENLILNVDGTYWRSSRQFWVGDIIGSRLQSALNGFGGADCTGTTPGANGCQFFNPFVLAGPENPTLDVPNPFYVPGFENSPELLSWLYIPNGTFQREEQWIGDAVLSGGTGFELPGGEVAFAVGAQFRKNNFSSRPYRSESNLNVNPCFIEGDTSCVGTPTEGVGPFIFLGGTRPTKLDQSVYALFTELSLPVLDTLEVSLALRFEDYGSPVGSTLNPKAAARFEATDWLTLRGSIGTTFRGPLASNVDDNFVTALAGLTAAGGNYKSVDIYGNPELDPETALTYNIGFIVDTGPLTFSADFWTYEFKDQIVTTPADAIASFVGNGQTTGTAPVNCSSSLAYLVTFSGDTCVQGTTTGLDIARVRTQFVNGPDVTVRGIDFAANYDIDAGFGVVSIGGNATWNLNYKTDEFSVGDVLVTEAYDAVGFGNYFRDPGTLPEWRANGYVNVRTGGLNLRYSVNYIDSVFDERCTGDPCFAIAGVPAGSNFGKNSGSYVQQDLVANYELPVEFAKVQLTAAVLNIFDEEPAQAYLPIGYNPFIGNAIGRNFRVGMRVGF